MAFELLKCFFFEEKKETEQKESKVKGNRFVSSVTGFWDSLAALPAYNCNKRFFFSKCEFKELN